MPSSFVDSVPPIIKLLIDLHQRGFVHSIVDVGCGWGKYGLMAREYLNDDTLIVDAVEVAEGRSGFKFDTQAAIYNHVEVADARELTADFWSEYDLVMLIDVIEHMDKQQGRRTLKRMIAGGARVLVSTPKIFEHQHDDQNPYEEHICAWTWQDCKPFRILSDVSTIDSIIYLLGTPYA